MRTPLTSALVLLGCTFLHALAAQVTAPPQSITVEAPMPTVELGATTSTTVDGSVVKDLPGKPPTLRDALPMVPGVTRTPEGRLNIFSVPEQRSALLINSLDVTDPATGKFGVTVPIDSVQTVNVYKSPFLAEYGRFTAGVVAVDTRRGGEKWHGEFNDPAPEFRIRSAHLAGVRGFTPRIHFNGPLQRGRLYYSQSVEYRLNKTPVFTLPFPQNETWRESWNSIAQLDYVPSSTRLVTVTLHAVPEKIKYANLNFYNPRPATPHYSGDEYQGGITDRLGLGGGLLESAFSYGRSAGDVWAQGDLPFHYTPTENAGHYFANQDRDARRFQWREFYSAAPLVAGGSHRIKFGGSLTRTRADIAFAARSVTVHDLSQVLLRRIDFRNRSGLSRADWEAGLFFQESWQPVAALTIDAGLRTDAQTITGLWRLAPRFGVAWSMPDDSRTVLRAGYGWFFDRVPLSVFGFNAYPEQVVTDYLTGGRAVHYLNVLEPVTSSQGLLVIGSKLPGNFAPRSRTWNLQAEHTFPKWLRLRAGYLQGTSSGLVTLRPGFYQEQEALLVGGRGGGRTRQFETVARMSWRAEQELLFSYVYSRARGNLNDFSYFLGDFVNAIVRPDQVAELSGNIRHRLLAWGVIPFAHGIRFAPMAEYRTGFPYSALDAAQNYAGTPNSMHFPPFFSLDLRLSKDIPVLKRKHMVRVAFSMFNVTNHWNPDTVRLNTADPEFGEFLGQHARRFRLDLDFLF